MAFAFQSDLVLAVHGIDCHEGVFEVQALQKLGDGGDGGDLVAFRIDLLLSKRDSVLAGPGTHNVQWVLVSSSIVRADLTMELKRFLFLLSLA
jgi:hypothetical protein